MTNTSNPAASQIAADIEIGTRFTLAEDFAAKKSLDSDAVYVVTAHRKIGKNEFCVAVQLADDGETLAEGAKDFNVQTKNLIIELPHELKEDEIIEEINIPRVTAHSDCDHAKTKSARAACRRARKNAAE